MVLSISLYIALILFVVGLLYKVFRWFRYSISMDAQDVSTALRLVAAFTGIISTLFSARFFTLVKVFIFDVVFNLRILREDALRWLMHMCIYGGFILLLLMHALGHYTSAVLFDNYLSTINPFFFLRDLFGALVLVGIAIAIYRRFIAKVPRLMTRTMDVYAIVLVAVIICSGIMLLGTRIASYKVYERMVTEYTVLDPQESRALEAY